MSDILTYPATGISQLIIEVLARDAVVSGTADTSTIQIRMLRSDRPEGPEFIPDERAVRFAHATAERVLMPGSLSVKVLEAQGDLRMQNLAGEIILDAVRGDLRLETLNGPVTIGEADADIRAEGVTQLTVLTGCSGDLRFTGGGILAADSVAGDLRLSTGVEAQIGRVSGDIWIEKTAGGVEIRRADGDVHLSEIGGAAKLAAISGDLRASGLGGLNAPRINGDATLSGPFAPGDGYHLTADGDVHVRLPADADVRLIVNAAGRIRSDIGLTPTADGTPTYSALVGQGASKIAITCRGDLRITKVGAEESRAKWRERGKPEGDPFADLSGLGDRIRQQVSASLAAAGINVETGEINLGRAERFRGWRGFRTAPPPPSPSQPPKPPKPAATTEEQLAILKMVEAGRITPEEAEKLLRALGA